MARASIDLGVHRRETRAADKLRTKDRQCNFIAISFRDIPCVVSSTCALFADDTLLYDRCYGVCTDQPCCRLEEAVRSLDTWAGGWCTTFNVSKSAHMFISSKHRRSGDTSRSSLSLSGGIIPLVRPTAHIGVRIASTRSWSDHVSNINRRVKFKAFLLKRLARRHGSADLVTVKRLYCFLVRPVFEYAAPAPIWDACSQLDTIAMERFQLSIARAILHVCRRQTHNVDVLATIGWPTLAWRRRRQKHVFVVGPSARRWSSLSAQPSAFARVFSLLLLFPQSFDAISSVVSYFPPFEVFSSFFCCSAYLCCLLLLQALISASC